MSYQNQQKASTGNLENIFDYAFPGVNLLQISMVRQKDMGGKEYKNQYFCFISITPGVKTDSGGRTFDRQGKVTMKMEADKVLALGYALEAYAFGNSDAIGPFSIFADTGKSQYSDGQGVKKILSIADGWKGGKQENGREVTFKMSQDKNILYHGFPIANALAAADILKFIAHKCLDAEYGREHVQIKERFSVSAHSQESDEGGGYKKPANKQQGFYRPSTPPPAEMNSGEDEEVPF